MIEALDIGGIAPLMIVFCGVLMVVLRAGASRVYFDVVGTFQAQRMLQDAQAMSTTMNSLMLDAFSGIEETAQLISEPIQQIVDELIPVTREVAEARIEFEKFVAEGEDADAVADSVMKIGHAFGFTADESLQAAARMAQLGGILGAGMTSTGTEVGIQFGLISGMETEAAMQRMINLQQQTDFMTDGLEENMTMEERAQHIRLNSMRVLDQLNTVENRSAATMEQVTYVMNQFASQAHLTGESIAYMAAMSATLIEAGEEQGKGGRALRMIYARLGANTSGAADALHELGIATTDAEGNLRPLSNVLRDLTAAMEDKSGAEKQAIAQAVAGNRHYVRLIKLMENYDRVEQLAVEAMLAMSPAMEEVNRRLEANIVALDIAEAKLHDYKAAIGDALLPAMIEATERSAVFATVMGELVTGSLGGGIKRLLSLHQTFSRILGPMFQMIINMKQLNVASQTYAVLQRAINGEQLVSNDFIQRMNGERFTENKLVMEAISLNQGLAEGKRMVNNLEREAMGLQAQMGVVSLEVLEQQLFLQSKGMQMSKIDLDVAKLRRNELVLEKAALDDLSKTEKASMARRLLNIKHYDMENVTKGQKGNITRKLNILMQDEDALMDLLAQDIIKQIDLIDIETKGLIPLIEARASNLAIIKEELTIQYGFAAAEQIMAHMEAARLERISMKESMEIQQKRSAIMGKFTMTTMMASAALMLFTDGEKSARATTVLTTMSMLPMIMQMSAASGAITAEATAKGFSAMVGEKLMISQFGAAFATNGLASAAKGAAASLTAMVIASGGMLLIGVAISAVLAKLGVFNTKFKETNDMMNNSPLMSGNNILVAFNNGLTDTSSRLRIVNDELAVYMDAWKDEYAAGTLSSDIKTKIDGLKSESAELQRAEDLLKARILLEGKDLDIIGDKAELFKEHLDDYRQLEELANYSGIHLGMMASAAEAIATRREHVVEMTKLADSIGIAYEDFVKLIDLGLVDTEKMLATLTLIGDLPSDIGDGISGITDELHAANDALYEFSNAREELFFGFASNNVTSDLVKQVVNKGVETLIANTEIIMTNNFNGMTTSEVADEILRQIERKAGSLSGVSISG